jgi:flagellar biosynthesis/type III secretory pathway M-ring protein FliF/YscJ
MNSLTPFGKTFLSAVLILLFAILVSIVWTNTKSPDCEHLYNEYSATTNVQMQQALLNEGVSNGCFHSN